MFSEFSGSLLQRNTMSDRKGALECHLRIKFSENKGFRKIRKTSVAVQVCTFKQSVSEILCVAVWTLLVYDCICTKMLSRKMVKFVFSYL